MAIVLGLDIHRQQITYDALDTASGEVPAETRALRGPKRRAKTDRADARHLRELLQVGRLPEAWIAPAHLQELRARVRLRQTLVAERTAWQQRIHATLFHHGLRAEPNLLTQERRTWLERLELTTAAREQLAVALRAIDQLNAELAPLERSLRTLARGLPGSRALIDRHFGVGELTALALLCELGDVRRFRSSRRAVRHAGLDITVQSSDGKRRPGRLLRQGPPLLRWAVYEAAQCASRPSSPDHGAYRVLSARLGHNRAKLTIARRLLRRAYHTLAELGDDALAPSV